MLQLPKTATAWGAPEFETTLKQELETADPGDLPLQAAITQGSHLGARPISVSVLSTQAEGGMIRAKVGIFFSSIIAGCNCADDPTPVDENIEYCQLALTIQSPSGVVEIELLED